MLKNMSIRKRILVILATVYVISLVIAVSGGYYILRQDTIREAKDKTKLFAVTMSGAQQYLATQIRPKALQMLPDAYFPEATVGILMLTQVARTIEQNYPGYIFRIASDNPLNPDNMTDAFEDKVIAGFINGDFENWEGFVERNGETFYSISTPLSAGQNCIWCHDTPEVAHPDMVAQYGTRSGYGYELGQIVGGRFIYVPMDIALAEARKKLAFFSGGFSLFFLIALVVIDRTIRKSVVKPIENIVEVATDISRGKMERDFEIKTNDEIRALADAFNRMKVSLAKAMDILSK